MRPLPPNFNDKVAHIICGKCGQKFQVLNDEGTDWNEPATAAQRDVSVASCPETPCHGK